jgi:hypothetical protein
LKITFTSRFKLTRARATTLRFAVTTPWLNGVSARARVNLKVDVDVIVIVILILRVDGRAHAHCCLRHSSGTDSNAAYCSRRPARLSASRFCDSA